MNMYRAGQWLNKKWDKLIKPNWLVTPEAATMEDWETWRKEYKTKNPIRYWLTEDLPIHVIVFHRRFISDPIWWVKHRTIHRYNILETGLVPGYYDYDTRIEKALFKAVVDHFEKETGWAYPEFKKLPKDKRYDFIVQKREEFIAELKNDEYGQDQAVREQEQLDIYKWIKTDYSTWKDGWDEVGIPEFRKKMEDLGLHDPDKMMLKVPEPYDSEYLALIKASHEVDKKHQDEVDAMLIRIIKVRHSLWY